MAGPRDIRSGRIPGTTTPAQQQQVQQTQKKSTKVSAQDAARVAQQAGFQRTRKKGAGGFDIGDSSQAPIPLPEDELDPDAWSQQALQKVQEHLDLAGPQFEEALQALTQGDSLEAGLVEGAFLPTEKDIARLESLSAKEGAPEPPEMHEVADNMLKLFGIGLDENTPLSQKMLAVGLVVAGEKEHVRGSEGSLEEKALIDGMQAVTKKSNQAVAQAQKMNKGIDEQLNLQRTFTFKR